MTLDNEKQKQDLASLLRLVPFQGNIAQNIDKMMDEVKMLIHLIENAEIEKPMNLLDKK